jgi:predicted patatin/cPLA2 family phospholipase
MALAQAPTLAAAREEIESQWKTLTNEEIYQVRGWEIFGLILKFGTTRMDLWPAVDGVDSIFDNTPLYKRYVENYLKLDVIRTRPTVDDFFVSLCSLNTGEVYHKSITSEADVQKARDYIMASTITTVAYPPVKTLVDDPAIPPHLRNITQYFADGGISNKTPLKAIFHAGDVSELYVINTYPSYPNKTEHSINARFPNVFSLLIRTAVELLPNLYFLRDMETVKDVNNDLRSWERVRAAILESVKDPATRDRIEETLNREEITFSFKEGNKHVITPVVICPDEELPVQDTEFVQPKLGETFEMGREKARQILGAMRSE